MNVLWPERGHLIHNQHVYRLAYRDLLCVIHVICRIVYVMSCRVELEVYKVNKTDGKFWSRIKWRHDNGCTLTTQRPASRLVSGRGAPGPGVTRAWSRDGSYYVKHKASDADIMKWKTDFQNAARDLIHHAHKHVLLHRVLGLRPAG